MSEVFEGYNNTAINIVDGKGDVYKMGHIYARGATPVSENTAADKINAANESKSFVAYIQNAGDTFTVFTNWTTLFYLSETKVLQAKIDTSNRVEIEGQELYMGSPVGYIYIPYLPHWMLGCKYNFNALTGHWESTQDAAVNPIIFRVFDIDTQEGIEAPPIQINYDCVVPVGNTSAELMLGCYQAVSPDDIAYKRFMFYNNLYTASVTSFLAYDPNNGFEFSEYIPSALSGNSYIPAGVIPDEASLAYFDSKGSTFSRTIITEEWLTGACGFNPFETLEQSIDEPDPDNPRPNKPEGGGGQQDYVTYEIDEPEAPDYDINNTGLLHIYNPTNTELASLASYMNSYNPVDLIRKNWSDPIESIIGWNVSPFPPVASTTGKSNIYFAGLDSGVNAQMIKQYVKYDFGSVTINEFYQTYIDYEGSNMQIVLPMIGTRDLDIQECMNSRMHLSYIVDFLTGACTANLKVFKNPSAPDANLKATLYSWQGNCFEQFPLTGTNYSQAIAGMAGLITGAVGGVGAIATGNVAGIIGSGASMVNAAQNIHAQRTSSGTIGANCGLMGVRQPFIVYTIADMRMPSYYPSLRGYNSQCDVKSLGALKGYHEIKDIRLNGINCTDNELEMIRSALANGVIF